MPVVHSDQFKEFWAAYPRRVAKLSALKAYDKAIKMGVEHELIIAGVRKYAAHTAGTDERYIAHPASWLNAGRWDDEYGPPRVARDDLTPLERAVLAARRVPGGVG